MKDNRAFTMIELLIVVSIVGILATIGIPTFRRMAAKTRKAEAKVTLGSIFTAETAFQAEFGGFGNHLPRLGVEMAALNNYSVGFPNAAGACANSTTFPPATGNEVGSKLTAEFPSYFDPLTPSGPITTVFLRTNASGLKCEQGIMTNDTFTATASGVIWPGLAASSDLAKHDTWTITEARVVKNTRDGANQ